MSEKIDINLADAETLATISGIGPALAERIIEYRQTVHPFEEVIELAAVPGISEKMVRRFEDLVTVQTVDPSTDIPLPHNSIEELPLLDAPDEMALLDAPAPPEALLTAEVAAPPSAPSEPETVEEIVIDTPEMEMEADIPEIVEEEDEETVETAVTAPPPPTPEIEELPLADSRQSTINEPDLLAARLGHPDAEWESKAQRRGCLNALVGATFGAILGAVLTLAVLAALNQGQLNFAASDAAIRQQLDSEIISRTNELNQLSTRVSLVATEEAASNQSLQDEFAAANDAINQEIADNEEIISYLATRSGDLELRLQEVAGAADTFTGFLDGLRGLLDELENGTATPTPQPGEQTVTPTPTFTPTPFGRSTATAEPLATTAVSPTTAPTRTPQPTATSFTFPTNTPAPQP